MELNAQEPQTNQEVEPQKQNAAAFVWDLVKIIVLAVAIIWPFRTFVAEPFVVSGPSMMPTFHNYDYLIIDRLSYRLHEPSRGEVIVFKFPRDDSQYFIKRVIGLPGETVCFSADCQSQDGHVYIFNKENPQGFQLNEPYLTQLTYPYAENQQRTLGDEEYYVLGDNRGSSSDSRTWGVLPKYDIVGKTWARVYPFASATFFNAPSY